MNENKQIDKEKEYKNKLIRILSTDIEGAVNLYAGIAKIKGVSWAVSNVICKKLKLDKRRKIGSLTQEEIKKIELFLEKPDIPNHLLNRRKDFESGDDLHLTATNLDLKKEFDIKRLKKIKNYRGVRHTSGLPLRGQRTKAHFRKNKSKGVGIKKKVKEKAAPYQK